MIIWLASYPRSGNTLLRMLLQECFGCETYSIYDDAHDIGAQKDFARTVGHVKHGLDEKSFIEKAASSSRPYFVKTHGAPIDDAKAIYIVRDGRSTVVSYSYYLKDFVGEGGGSLEEIVLGNCNFGSWSDHFKAWKPKERLDTLLLRYDQLAGNPVEAIKSIAEFTGLPVLKEKISSFGDLKKIDSRFFRSGSDEKNIGELEGEALDLFWLLHGELMIDLGFSKSTPTVCLSKVGKTMRDQLTKLRAIEADMRMLHEQLALTQTELADAQEELSASETTLDSGIDFAHKKLPRFVAEISGLSYVEDFGRWSDGDRVTIRFRQPLPRRFTLELVGWLGGFLQNRDIEVKVGDYKKMIRMNPGVPSICSLGVSNPKETNEISIQIPGAVMPPNSADPRRLGLALSRLRVSPFSLWWPGSSIREKPRA